MGLEKPSSSLASTFKARVHSQPEQSYLEWLQLIQRGMQGELLAVSSLSASPYIGKRLLVMDNCPREKGGFLDFSFQNPVVIHL